MELISDIKNKFGIEFINFELFDELNNKNEINRGKLFEFLHDYGKINPFALL